MPCARSMIAQRRPSQGFALALMTSRGWNECVRGEDLTGHNCQSCIVALGAVWEAHGRELAMLCDWAGRRKPRPWWQQRGQSSYLTAVERIVLANVQDIQWAGVYAM